MPTGVLDFRSAALLRKAKESGVALPRQAQPWCLAWPSRLATHLAENLRCTFSIEALCCHAPGQQHYEKIPWELFLLLFWKAVAPSSSLGTTEIFGALLVSKACRLCTKFLDFFCKQSLVRKAWNWYSGKEVPEGHQLNSWAHRSLRFLRRKKSLQIQHLLLSAQADHAARSVTFICATLSARLGSGWRNPHNCVQGRKRIMTSAV